MRRTRRIRAEAGTQVVELALMTPLLVLLVLIIIEGAAMIQTHQVLNNAAREGARLSSVNDCSGDATCLTAIQQAVVQYGADNGVTITTAQVAVNQSIAVVGPGGVLIPASQVTVTRPYPLPLLSGLPWFSVPATVTLAGTAEFRNFQAY
jgi:Flp pilus assembly protein TadG